MMVLVGGCSQRAEDYSLYAALQHNNGLFETPDESYI